MFKPLCEEDNKLLNDDRFQLDLGFVTLRGAKCAHCDHYNSNTKYCSLHQFETDSYRHCSELQYTPKPVEKKGEPKPKGFFDRLFQRFKKG